MRRKLVRAASAVFVFTALLPGLARAQEISGNFPEGSVLVGYDNSTCNASWQGSIRYSSASGILAYCNGAAWTALVSSGSITAAGADKQVQFNNGGVLGASANFIWDNASGRLGIGTANPVHRLDVQSSTDAYIRAGGIAAAEAGFKISKDGTTSWTIFQPALSSDLRFYNGNPVGTGWTLRSGGNFGVDDTSPDYKFEVSSPIGSDSSFALSDSDTAWPDRGSGYGCLASRQSNIRHSRGC